MVIARQLLLGGLQMKFIGIMTGNSLDAIDCVLTEFDNDKIHDICGHSAEIPPLIANDFRTLKQKLSQNGGDICSFYNTETEFFTNLHIDEFYSDSISDFPLSLCAQKAFLVVKHGKKVKSWPKISMKTTEKIQKTKL